MDSREFADHLLEVAKLTEGDDFTLRILELATRSRCSHYMRRFDQAEREDIIADALRRALENRERFDPAAQPTPGLQKYLQRRGKAHDPLMAFWLARLREAQRHVERQKQREPRRGRLEEVHAIEEGKLSRVRITGRKAADHDDRPPAPIDEEIVELRRHRVVGSNGKRCCRDRLCWHRHYHKGFSPAYTDLRLPVGSDPELAEAELVVRWEKAWIAARHRDETGAEQVIDPLAFHFDVLRSDGSVLREGKPLN